MRYILILFPLIALGNSIKAQDFIGKTYKALIRQSCKEMSDGGCMINTYQLLKFHSDSVYVFNEVKVNCSNRSLENEYEKSMNHPGKNYTWHFTSDTLYIEGIVAFGKLLFQNSNLYYSSAGLDERVKFEEVLE